MCVAGRADVEFIESGGHMVWRTGAANDLQHSLKFREIRKQLRSSIGGDVELCPSSKYIKLKLQGRVFLRRVHRPSLLALIALP